MRTHKGRVTVRCWYAGKGRHVKVGSQQSTGVWVQSYLGPFFQEQFGTVGIRHHTGTVKGPQGAMAAVHVSTLWDSTLGQWALLCLSKTELCW